MIDQLPDWRFISYNHLTDINMQISSFDLSNDQTFDLEMDNKQFRDLELKLKNLTRSYKTLN